LPLTMFNAAAVALTLLVAGSTHFSWQLCSGSETDRFSVTNLTISPVPVLSNTSQLVKATLLGKLSGSVTNGSVDLSLTYAGAYVYQTSMNLCDVDKKHMPCPIESGAVKINTTLSFPALPYTGALGGFAQVSDQDGNELSCITYTLPVA